MSEPRTLEEKERVKREKAITRNRAMVKRAMEFEKRERQKQEQLRAGNFEARMTGRRVSVVREQQREERQKKAAEERNANLVMTKEQRAIRNAQISKEVHACFNEGRYTDANKLMKLSFTRHGGCEIKDLDGNTLLTLAVKVGGDCLCNLDECDCMWRGRKGLYAVKTLLMKNAKTDTADNDGLTPLHVAVTNSATDEYYLPIVETLLQGGASHNEELMAPTERVENHGGRTPLHVAARLNEPRTVDMLIRFNADVNAKDKHAWTPLHHALAEGRTWAKARRAYELRLARGEEDAAASGSGSDAGGGEDRQFSHLDGEEREAALNKWRGERIARRARREWLRRNAVKRKAAPRVGEGALTGGADADNEADAAYAKAQKEKARRERRMARFKAMGGGDGDEGADASEYDSSSGSDEGDSEGEEGGTEGNAAVQKGFEDPYSMGVEVSGDGQEVIDPYSTDEAIDPPLGHKLGGFDDDPTLTAKPNPFFGIALQLLENGADTKRGNNKVGIRTSTLHYSCRYRELRITKLLLRFVHGPEDGIDLTDAMGNTPLNCAVKSGGDVMRDTVTMLLDRGCNPNIADEEGWTPLHVAVDLLRTSRRYTHIVRMLLVAGANTELPENRDSRTPLMTAAIEGQRRVLKMLLRPEVHRYKKVGMWRKANPDTRDRRGWTPLHAVIWLANGGSLDEDENGDPIEGDGLPADEISDAMADEKSVPSDELNRAQLACRRYMNLARDLLECGAAPALGNSTIGHDVTLLHYAAMHHQPHVAALLLEFGATPNGYALVDFNQWMPLHLAARVGNAAVVKLLLAQNDVDPFSLDPYDRTAKDIADVAEEGGEEGVSALSLGKREAAKEIEKAMQMHELHTKRMQDAQKAANEDRVDQALALSTEALENAKPLDTSGRSIQQGLALTLRSSATLKASKPHHLRLMPEVVEEIQRAEAWCKKHGQKLAPDENEKLQEKVQGYMRVEKNKMWKSALDDAQRAVQMAPKSWQAWEQYWRMLVLHDKHHGAQEAEKEVKRLGHTIRKSEGAHAWEEKLQLGEGVTSASALAKLRLLVAPASENKTPSNVFVWGFNQHANLGLGYDRDEGDAQPSGAFSDRLVKHAAVGQSHAVLTTLSSNGEWETFSWGQHNNGQLGLGHKEVLLQDTPQLIERLRFKPVRTVACGRFHTLVLTAEGDFGQVYGFGLNSSGELGLGHTESPQNYPQLIQAVSMVRAKPKSRGKSKLVPRVVSHIACGGNHSLFAFEGGGVVSCGRNSHGQLGLGSMLDHCLPKLIAELATRRVSAMAAGVASSLVSAASADVQVDETVLFGFGRNNYGQLGVGDTLDHSVPQFVRLPETALSWQEQQDALDEVARQEKEKAEAKARAERTKAAPSATSIKQLLTTAGTLVESSAPAVADPTMEDGRQAVGMMKNEAQAPVAIGIRAFACGGLHSVVVLDDGRTFSFGHNGYGELGVGTYEHQHTPQIVRAMAGKEVVQVACGHHHTLFMTAGDGAYACGWDQYGQLGVGRDPVAESRIVHSAVGHRGMECNPKLLRLSVGAGDKTAIVDMEAETVKQDNEQAEHEDVDDAADDMGGEEKLTAELMRRNSSTDGRAPTLVAVNGKHSLLDTMDGAHLGLRIAPMCCSHTSLMYVSDGGNISPLIYLLVHSSVDGRAKAAMALSKLMVHDDSRVAAREAGVFPPLKELLDSRNSHGENAATQLLCALLLNAQNRLDANVTGCTQSLAHLLRYAHTEQARENAGRATRLLALVPAIHAAMMEAGCVPALVKLMEASTARGKAEAALALSNISINNSQARYLIRDADGLEPMCDFFRSLSRPIFPPPGWEDELNAKK